MYLRCLTTWWGRHKIARQLFRRLQYRKTMSRLLVCETMNRSQLWWAIAKVKREREFDNCGRINIWRVDDWVFTKKREKIKKIKIKRDEKKLIKWGEIEHDDNISFQNIEFPNKFLRMIVLESDTRLKCMFSLVYMYIYVYIVTSREYVPFWWTFATARLIVSEERMTKWQKEIDR